MTIHQTPLPPSSRSAIGPANGEELKPLRGQVIDLGDLSGVASSLLKPRGVKAMTTTEAQNKTFVLEAFDTLFNKRDYAAAERFWSPAYIQHSAHIAPGCEGLFELVKTAPKELHYENALIVAEGDYVMLHGRFSGIGQPVNWVVVDILRIDNGLLAEHWDVIQDEATRRVFEERAAHVRGEISRLRRNRMDFGPAMNLSTLKGSSPREIPFNGVRLRFDSNKSFDEVLSSLLADVGDKPLLTNEVAAKSEGWDTYSKEIESRVGPSGFILFATIDHGAWIKKSVSDGRL